MTEPLGGRPNPGTKPDKRLKENAPCGPGMEMGPAGKCVESAAGAAAHFTAVTAATDAPWDGSAGRFSDAQYQNAAAACDPASKGTVKERCFLPHHEPGGALNINGMHAAAQRASSVSGRTPEAVARAKAHLRSHYSQQGEKPPDSIKAEADVLVADATPPPDWRGVLVVEGTPTGDGREFAMDSVEWPDPAEVPMIFQWQKESSHGGDHDVTVAVGRIDRLWRDGSLIYGEGRFDTHPDAIEAKRRNAEGMCNGVSINADDISDQDVERVYEPSTDDADEGDEIIRQLFGRPDKVIFHMARLRAATLCDIPAFIESVVHAVDSGDEAMVASAPPRPHAAVSVHESKTSNGPWDPAAQEARLRSEFGVQVAMLAYAYVEPDDDPATSHSRTKDQCRFLHHEIAETGEPGPANISACLAGIQAMHGSTIPDSDKGAVYTHLAAHLRAAGVEPPPYEVQHALMAHAWQEDIWRPPAEWFQDPGLKMPTPIIVTDQGRVYGLATEWGECHIGHGGECILPPRETYHDRFLTGEQPLDDGTSIAVGTITAGIGHASMARGMNPNRAAEHYDNTEAVVAHVNIGNCRAGIWVAGGVPPWAQSARVQALRASGEVSPDWRRIGGKLRMVGLLTVNVSGYQVPRLRTLVAGGQVQAMIASGLVSVHLGPSNQALDQRALQIMSDRLAQRVGVD